eukprot:CAMPEP_0197420192 /NCGR_PEP_ID=MMETSP1170-20131217/5663_1 /TAXON_ID=54406 /ORGANISM="Sarcinochrysis sp, Strain CCMP770" /LENGTH=102 /DNA_ID=CAMNT_0042947337 /DNA_START=76 /DNA_END=382 /DNA_ORIENTATION=+
MAAATVSPAAERAATTRGGGVAGLFFCVGARDVASGLQREGLLAGEFKGEADGGGELVEGDDESGDLDAGEGGGVVVGVDELEGRGDAEPGDLAVEAADAAL